MPDVRRARLYKQQSRRPFVKPTALPSPTHAGGYVGRRTRSGLCHLPVRLSNIQTASLHLAGSLWIDYLNVLW